MRWAASSGLQLARLHSSSLRAPTNGLRAGRWAHDESAFERATHYAARVAATRLRFLGLQGTRAGSEQAVRAWMTAGERWPPWSWAALDDLLSTHEEERERVCCAAAPTFAPRRPCVVTSHVGWGWAMTFGPWASGLWAMDGGQVGQSAQRQLLLAVRVLFGHLCRRRRESRRPSPSPPSLVMTDDGCCCCPESLPCADGKRPTAGQLAELATPPCELLASSPKPRPSHLRQALPAPYIQCTGPGTRC